MWTASIPDLKAYVVQLGLDPAVFNPCLDSGRHKVEVDRDWQEAFRLGFIGTPSFLVNQQKLVGSASFGVRLLLCLPPALF
jgi:protein-disulfide isomerase